MVRFLEKNYYLILVVIFTLGFLLRGVELINGNYLFGFDQGRDYLLVKEMVDNFKPRLIGAEVASGAAGISYLFHGPFYLYFLAIFYILFKGDPYGGVVMMFLFGMGTLILTFFISRKMFSKFTALIITFLVAISPTLAPQSRFLWSNHPSSFFIILTFYLIFLIPKKPIIFLPLSLFTAGFIYNFELAVAVPFVIAIIIHSIFILKIRKPKILTASIIALMLAFLPFLIFEVKHGFNVFKGFSDYLTQTKEDTSLMFELFTFRDHIMNYWNNFIATFSFFSIVNNLYFHLLFLIIFIFGSKKAVSTLRDKSRKKLVKFILILIISSLLFFLILKNIIWDYYLIHLHFAYIILFSVIFMTLVKKRNWFLVGILSIYLIVMTLATGQRIYLNYNIDFKDYGGGQKIRGKIDVIDYIYEDAGDEKFNVLVFMPPVYTYPYDYLFSWYGKEKYGYVPGNEKKETFYLLIEPDSGKPWSYKGWEETVVKSGEVLWTKELPSGLIVEKRYEKSEN